MRRIATALLGLSLLATPAVAEFDQGPLPMSQGNEWVYRATSGGEVTVRVDGVQASGPYRFYRLRGFNGTSAWVRQTAAGRVYNSNGGTWYRFDAATGASWIFRTTGAAIAGSNGATVTVVGQESVTVPAGTFQAIHLRWQGTVAGAGIRDEWFARGVGLVKRVEAGRTLSLTRATVAGQSIPAGGGGIIPVLTGGGAFGISGEVPASRVRLRTILAQGLSRPAAMAFHPDRSLWIVNRGDDSTVIVDGAGTAQQQARKFVDDSDHFNNNPLAIAFSRSRVEVAVGLESINDYNGAAPGNYFTGPTLFTGDRSIFQGGASSHLDMLHHSPLVVGIAAGARPASGTVDRREYWVFNGYSGCIDRYYFNEPHVLGGHDHADGLTYRYGSGLRRVSGVPGHLTLDTASGMLYIADTGNGRIARLDTRLGSLSQAPLIQGIHSETPLRRVQGVQIQTLTPSGALTRPAGLILANGKLVVSDHATGKISVFGLNGQLEGVADTGVGANALAGLVETPGGKLYVLDARNNRVLEVEILP